MALEYVKTSCLRDYSQTGVRSFLQGIRWFDSRKPPKYFRSNTLVC